MTSGNDKLLTIDDLCKLNKVSRLVVIIKGSVDNYVSFNGIHLNLFFDNVGFYKGYSFFTKNKNGSQYKFSGNIFYI
jgi:hypothetical protein